MDIFYFNPKQEITDKINNYIFTFLFCGTLTFSELQIDSREPKLLKELLYSSSSESSVTYMSGLVEFHTKPMTIISSFMELLFDRFSKTSIVTENVDDILIRHRNNHILYKGSNVNNV